jgi:hypothetical protein
LSDEECGAARRLMKLCRELADDFTDEDGNVTL